MWGVLPKKNPNPGGRFGVNACFSFENISLDHDFITYKTDKQHQIKSKTYTRQATVFPKK